MTIELTTNNNIYYRAKELLNRELKAATELLKETEDAWNEYMDLKLHDAFTENIDFELYGAKVIFDDEAQGKWFYRFCEDTYECFKDWCEGEGVDFDDLRENVGRTSKFYLGGLHNDETDKYLTALYAGLEDIRNTMIELKEENGIVMVDEEKTLKILEEYDSWDEEQMISEMLNLTTSIMSDLHKALDEITVVYNYIKDTKENQVEYFKEYVKDNWLANAS